jgi:hypothetical protein
MSRHLEVVEEAPVARTKVLGTGIYKSALMVCFTLRSETHSSRILFQEARKVDRALEVIPYLCLARKIY